MPARVARTAARCSLFLLLTFPTWGIAQDPAPPGALPPEVQQRIVNILNDPGVTRVGGPTRLPAGSMIEGDLAVLGGPVVVGGEIRGRLVVVNGDLLLEPGSIIRGELLLVGGRISGAGAGHVGGTVETHPAPLRYQIRGGWVVATDPGPGDGPLSADLGVGRARFMLMTGNAYSRVEGLPVLFGPRIEGAGRNPTVFEALGIWRSASGLTFSTEELGYRFRLRQSIGGRGLLTLGAGAHSEFAPVESRGVSDLESSLSTFFLRTDLRDHFERQGWEGWVEVRPAQLPVWGRLGYREEEHRYAPILGPWTLGNNDQAWRPQSLVAEGRSRTVEAMALLDTRNDPVEPTDGWWVEASARQLVGGNLKYPLSDDPVGRYTSVTGDVRHYARVSPTSRLSVRGYLSGSISGTPLPPQNQRSLGGEGSLPGHPNFSVACGAREGTVVRPSLDAEEDPNALVYGQYGCDRVALFQAEFRGTLPFSWEPSPQAWREWEWRSLINLQPSWALFLNAGRGWTSEAEDSLLPRFDSSTRADIGAGIFVGPLGLYWAYPLNQQDRGINFFVRLQQRF